VLKISKYAFFDLIEERRNHFVAKMAHGDMSADMPPHFIGK
jgi:hypothetical protein